jgi:hypothetical protein
MKVNPPNWSSGSSTPPMPESLRLPLLAAVGLAIVGPRSHGRRAVQAAILGSDPDEIASPFVKIAVASAPDAASREYATPPPTRATLDAIDDVWSVSCATHPVDVVVEALFTAYRRAVLAAAMAHDVSTADVIELLERQPWIGSDHPRPEGI